VGNYYKRAVIATALLISAAAAGCAGNKDSAEKKAIIDDYAGIILLQDRDSAEFDAVLEAIGEYIDSPYVQMQEAAVKILDDTIQKMEEDSASCEEYETPEDMARMLENQGISKIEYEINANTRYDALQAFLYDLEYLRFYTEVPDPDDTAMADLKIVYSLISEEQKQIRAYNYTGINYWFAGWDKESEKYVREQVIDKLKSFEAEDAVWEDSRDAVEARMNTYLDRVEELDGDWAELIGRSQEELNQAREELPENE